MRAEGVKIGQQWAFRDHPKTIGEPVHRVEVVRLDGPRREKDVHVRFLDGDEAGLQEWVYQHQLVVPWADVESFFGDDRRWLVAVEASRDARGTPEFDAAKLIFDAVRPKNRVRFRHTKADAGILEIPDLAALAKQFELDVSELQAADVAFSDRNGVFVASCPVTRTIAQRLVLVIGGGLLDKLMRQEQALREEMRSEPWSWRDRQCDKQLEGLTPLIDVLRSWCGHDAVERFDELRALRLEVERLGDLVQRAAKELRSRKCHAIAATIERDLGVLGASPGTGRR